MRNKVREKDGFLWGLGGASNITCVLSPAACRGKAATRAISVADVAFRKKSIFSMGGTPSFLHENAVAVMD
jgi:hypothetical protein